ncbi:hypothetical protein NIES3275_69300 [Microchaete diplosiphon NIES-3275]|nr:hypothetical protein NIES3275_69300 [Microchaete diplosiphon NIES-3275]
MVGVGKEAILQEIGFGTQNLVLGKRLKVKGERFFLSLFPFPRAYSVHTSCFISIANVGVDIANVSVDIANVWVDIANVSVDIANVWVDIANVSVDIANVWVDIANVRVDIANVSVDITNV